MAHETRHGEAGEHSEHTHIEMPAPTFWPMVLAFGIALLFAGMVTHWAVSATGLVIALCAAIGWWHDVIPHERHEEQPIEVGLRQKSLVDSLGGAAATW